MRTPRPRRHVSRHVIRHVSGLTPRHQAALRVAALLVLTLAVVISIMMAALAVAMRRNDAAIEAHLARATATVLTVSPLRTGIEFVTVDGATVRPPDGVLYPGLLSPGQKFVVEYSTADPDLVRVAGRTAGVGTIMIIAVLAVTWIIAAPLAYLLRRRSSRALLRRRSADPAIAGTGADGGG